MSHAWSVTIGHVCILPSYFYRLIITIYWKQGENSNGLVSLCALVMFMNLGSRRLQTNRNEAGPVKDRGYDAFIYLVKTFQISKQLKMS